MYYLRTWPILLLLSTLLLTAAAGAYSSDNSLTRLKAPPRAPEFILQDSNGKQHALSDYRGRVVVINFWASWCPPCIVEMPSLQRAADRLAQHQIPVLGIGVGENQQTIMRFLRSTPVSFPLLLDTKSEIYSKWSIPSLPTTLVINRDGRIALLAVGEREWDSPEILDQIIALTKTP